jgi:CDP-glucose 4,6-dehydratase
VIGGGDFANDRIIPDCIRAVSAGREIIVRNPHSIRPYQHVLEPLFIYLTIAMKQYEDQAFAGYYNVGPDDRDCVTTGALADLFCQAWGKDAAWIDQYDGGPHEANFLKLDCSKIKQVFGWQPRMNIQKAVEWTVEWTKAYLAGEDILRVTDSQIYRFFHCDKA